MKVDKDILDTTLNIVWLPAFQPIFKYQFIFIVFLFRRGHRSVEKDYMRTIEQGTFTITPPYLIT